MLDQESLQALTSLQSFLDTKRNYRREDIQNFLGVDVKSQNAVGESFPLYEFNVVSVTFSKWIQEKEFKIVSVTEFDYDGARAIPNYANVDIGPTQSYLAFDQGWIFLSYQEIPFAIQLWKGSKHGGISITSRKEHKEKASSILKVLKEKIIEENFYRGHKIEMRSNLTFQFIELVNSDWDQLVLDETLQEEIQDNVMGFFQNSELYKKYGIPLKRGLLFEGPPGTGKTRVCAAIANQTKCTFIRATSLNMKDENDFKYLFEAAKKLSPTILVLEDLDLYAGDREGPVNTALLGELFNQLDGLVSSEGVVIIGTTNNADAIEPALRDRPSRFDRRLRFEFPEPKQREKLLQLFSREFNVKGIDWQPLVEGTDKFTGAHIKELVTLCTLEAIKFITPDQSQLSLTQEHFAKALSKMKRLKKELGFSTETSKEVV